MSPGLARRRDDRLQGRPRADARRDRRRRPRARHLDTSPTSSTSTCPTSPDIYVHRIGRTGRVGRIGPRDHAGHAEAARGELEAIERHAKPTIAAWSRGKRAEQRDRAARQRSSATRGRAEPRRRSRRPRPRRRSAARRQAARGAAEPAPRHGCAASADALAGADAAGRPRTGLEAARDRRCGRDRRTAATSTARTSTTCACWSASLRRGTGERARRRWSTRSTASDVRGVGSGWRWRKR